MPHGRPVLNWAGPEPSLREPRTLNPHPLHVGAGELKALLVGLTMTAAGDAVPLTDLEADVRYLMSQFDSNQNGEICRSEFHGALLRCGYPVVTPSPKPTSATSCPSLSCCGADLQSQTHRSKVCDLSLKPATLSEPLNPI